MRNTMRTIQHILAATLVISAMAFSPRLAQSQGKEGEIVPSDLSKGSQNIDEGASAEIDAIQTLRISNYTRNGSQLYKKSKFNEALWQYEQAQRLAPENEQLKAVIADTVKQHANQKALQRQLLDSGKDQSEYVVTTYDKAIADFNMSQTTEARIGFQRVWLLSGDYKETLNYLKKLSGAQENLDNSQPETIKERAPKVLRVDEPPVIASPPAKISSTPQKDDIIKEYDTTIQLYEQILKIYPDDVQARSSMEGVKKMRQQELDRRATAESINKQIREPQVNEIPNQPEVQGKVGTEAPVLQMTDNTGNLSQNNPVASQTAKTIETDKAEPDTPGKAMEEKLPMTEEQRMAKARTIANLVLDARKALKEGNEEEALECYHKALVLAPTSALAQKEQQDILRIRSERLLAVERESKPPVQVIPLSSNMQDTEAKRHTLETEITQTLNAIRESGDAAKYDKIVGMYRAAWKLTLQSLE